MIKRLIAVLLLAGLGAVFWQLMQGYAPDAALNRTAAYYAEHTVPLPKMFSKNVCCYCVKMRLHVGKG